MTEAFDHEAAFELLPWFVNGTLSEAERTGVDLHVRSCVPCRIALQEQCQLEKVLQEQPTVPLSAESGFNLLLDELTARQRTARTSMRDAWFVLSSGLLSRHAVTAAVLVLSLGIASLLATIERESAVETEFVTLTGQAAADFEIDVVFSDGLSARERDAVISSIGGEIAGEPSNLGRYRVRISDGAQQVEDVLQRLQADSRVRFAAQAFAEETTP